MKRPLYIENRKAPRVRLDEGALAIRCKGEAERLVPIDRISRVITHAAVPWEHPALPTLARHGIPVIFVDDQGRTRARMLGRQGEPGALARRLDELIARPDGIERYHLWLEHEHQRPFRELATRHPELCPSDMGVKFRERLLRKLVRIAQTSHSAPEPDRLEGQIHALVQEWLGKIGVGATTPQLTGAVIDLPSDLSGILQTRVWIEWAGLELEAPSRTKRNRANRFHAPSGIITWITRLEPHARALIARLHKWTATEALE